MTVLPFPVAHNVVRLPVDLIREDVVQLRTLYPEESLAELRDSIEEEGVMQPILVAPTEDETYELVIGSRRLRAEKLRGSDNILAMIIEPKSPLNYILMALAENIHRENLDPFEEARGFLRLMKEYDLGTMEIASKTRKSAQYVARRLQLVSLPEEVQVSIAQGELGIEFATVLGKLPSGESQAYYADRAIRDKLTSEELRALMRREGPDHTSYRKRASPVSIGKVHVRLELFTEWMRELPVAILVRRANSDERNAIIRALESLESEIRTIKAQFEGKRLQAVSHINATPRNEREHWPHRDLKKITAEDRPSDEELGRELGRTVSAIRSMRSKVNSRKHKAS